MNKNWRVWGRLAGPALPSRDVEIGKFHIGPLTDLGRPPDPVDRIEVSAAAHSGYHQNQTRLVAYSPCWAYIDVAAESMDAAYHKVDNEHLPLLLAALNFGEPDRAYRVQIVGCQDSQRGYGRWSQVKAAHFAELEMHDDRLVQAKKLTSTIGDDDRARRAAELLNRAARLTDSGSDIAVLVGALLTYFQSIEVIAHAIPWSPPADYETRQSQIVGRLNRKLDTGRGPSKKASSIHEAANELNRLDERYASLRIASAGAALNLSKEWTSCADQFVKLRNSRLGHAGTGVTSEDLEEWLTGKAAGISARTLAATMFEAYVSGLEPV